MKLDILNKRIYYNVPPCPSCGSEITGRYIRCNGNNTTNVVTDGLRHGEIIKITTTKRRDVCFCLECGTEWDEHISASFVDKERIQEEYKKRHIAELEEMLRESEKESRKKSFGFF